MLRSFSESTSISTTPLPKSTIIPPTGKSSKISLLENSTTQTPTTSQIKEAASKAQEQSKPIVKSTGTTQTKLRFGPPTTTPSSSVSEQSLSLHHSTADGPKTLNKNQRKPITPDKELVDQLLSRESYQKNSHSKRQGDENNELRSGKLRKIIGQANLSSAPMVKAPESRDPDIMDDNQFSSLASEDEESTDTDSSRNLSPTMELEKQTIPLANPSVLPDGSSLANVLKDLGLHRFRIPGDGNCLFNSLELGEYSTMGDEETRLRQDVAESYDYIFGKIWLQFKKFSFIDDNLY
jgi:hypothetical protein